MTDNAVIDATDITKADEPGNQWEKIVTGWRSLSAAINASHGPEDVTDSLYQAESHAWSAMLDYPAPNLAALRVKLEVLLQVEPAVDSINPWTGKTVHQTIADIARLLV